MISLKCIVCGEETETEEQRCANCIKIESSFQVLTLEEQQGFHGVTLEQGREEQSGRQYKYDNVTGNQRIYSRQFSLGTTSFLTKVVLGIVFVGILFVALPVVILGISIISFILYFFRK